LDEVFLPYSMFFQSSEGQLPKGAAYLDSPKQGERSGNRLGQPPPPQQQLYRSPYEQGLLAPAVCLYLNNTEIVYRKKKKSVIVMKLPARFS
jgi:hypothetical protein